MGDVDSTSSQIYSECLHKVLPGAFQFDSSENVVVDNIVMRSIDQEEKEGSEDPCAVFTGCGCELGISIC